METQKDEDKIFQLGELVVFDQAKCKSIFSEGFRRPIAKENFGKSKVYRIKDIIRLIFKVGKRKRYEGEIEIIDLKKSWSYFIETKYLKNRW